ncbi:MAG: RDD family protein [Dehalococcoidia bacterium]
MVCGTRLSDTAAFCANCGAPVGATTSPSVGGVQSQAPRQGTVDLGGTHYELASFLRRFGAVLIDGVIASFIFGALFGSVVFGIVFAVQEASRTGGEDAAYQLAATSIHAALRWLLPLVIAGTAIQYVFEVYGWSLGKAALGIRALRRDGHRPGWVHGAARYVGKQVSGAVLLLGYLWAAFDPQRQAWHDKFADTYVVRVPLGGIVTPSTPAPLSISIGARVWAVLAVLYALYNISSVTTIARVIPDSGPALRRMIEAGRNDENPFEPRFPRNERIEPSGRAPTDLGG